MTRKGPRIISIADFQFDCELPVRMKVQQTRDQVLEFRKPWQSNLFWHFQLFAPLVKKTQTFWQLAFTTLLQSASFWQASKSDLLFSDIRWRWRWWWWLFKLWNLETMHNGVKKLCINPGQPINGVSYQSLLRLPSS